MAELYKGQAGSPITYLASDISANQTTISIDDDSALPDAPNICTIGYGENLETIKYGVKSNGVLQNVTRGIEGTPQAWQAGTEVARFFTAYDHNSIIENFNSHLADYASLIAGGEEYTLTLQNGWTGTLKYRKNGLGQVHIKGTLASPSSVATRQIIATLPSGYRPSQNLAFNAYNGFVGRVLLMGVISTNGNIALELSVASEAQEAVAAQNYTINLIYDTR